MDAVIIAPVIGLIACAAGLGVAFARLTARGRVFSPADLPPQVPRTPFAPSRYRPMQRLLDEADWQFLASHPGATAQLRRKFRRGRTVIFRGYMRELAKDFHRTCRAIKLHLVHSEKDRAELAGAVVKAQIRFAVTMIYAEFRLTLYGFGWSGVEVAGLIQSFEGMHAQLQQLAASAAPAAA